MAIKFLFVLTCFSLACCIVWAGPTEIVVRSEESRWIAEVIGTAEDGWPEIISRQSYPTHAQATSRQLVLQEKFKYKMQKAHDIVPLTVKGSLWPTTQSWSDEWEHKYAKWIETDVDTEFFVRYKVATDCADVAYSLRWIFSRIHGLPAAATLGDGKIFISNEMVRPQWASLPTSGNWYEDRRFLAALNYLLDMTYTHSLWMDSYPVALNKESLISGSYHLNLHDNSGHTQVIHWMDSDAGVPFLTLNSTIPRKVRSLSDWMLSAGPPQDKKSGLLRFRWAVKKGTSIVLKNPTEMPGYSLEQFSFKPQKDFTIALFEKLGYTGGKEGIREYLYKDIISQFKARIEVVKEGVQKCVQTTACAPGTAAWEDWSTPSRDSRIKGKLSSLLAVEEGTSSSPHLKDSIIELENVPWSLEALIWNWNNDEFSSDPQVGEVQRWGAGGVTWAQLQMQFFKNKLQERQDVLRKGRLACAGKDCRFGTSLWNTTSSNALDIQLNKKTRYLKNGRTVIPSGAWTLLDAAAPQALVNIQGQEITLAHVLDAQASMNSSAMAPPEQQWGLGPWTAIGFTSIPQVIKNKFAIDQIRPGDGILWNLETGKKVPVPFSVLGSAPDLGILLVREGEDLFLYSLESGHKKALPSAFASLGNGAFSFSGDLFSVQLADHLQIFSVDPGTLDLNLKGEAVGAPWTPMGGGLYRKETSLFDVRNLRQVSGITAQMSLCTSDAFAILLGRGVFIVDRVSGGILKTDDVMLTSASCERRELFVIEKKNSKDVSVIMTFDKDLKTHRGQEFDGVCYFQAENTLTCNTTRYSLVNGQWRKEDPKASRYSLKNVVGKGYELIENSTGRTLFSARFINLIQDRYLAITVNEGEPSHLVDMQHPEFPSVTNAVVSQYGIAASVVGDFVHIMGFGPSLASSVLWKTH